MLTLGPSPDRRSYGILGGRVSVRSACGPRAGALCVRFRWPPFAHAVALAFRREDRRVMREAVEERRGQLLVTGKHGDPFREREVECGAYCYAESRLGRPRGPVIVKGFHSA